MRFPRVATLAVAAVLAVTGCAPTTQPAAPEVDDTTSSPPASSRPAEPKTSEPAAPKKPKPKPEPALTASQQNAVRSAESYIAMSPFSRTGLIEQLVFEGYPKTDAVFAVDHLDVDWKQQAARSAKAYLEMSPFSRSGLVEQLVFEGYTREQAEYGATKAGL